MKSTITNRLISLLACGLMAVSFSACRPAVTSADGSKSTDKTAKEDTEKTEEKKTVSSEPKLYYSHEPISVYGDSEGKTRAQKDVEANEVILVTETKSNDRDHLWGFAENYGWVVISDGLNELTEVTPKYAAVVDGDVAVKEEADVLSVPNQNGKKIGTLKKGTVIKDAKPYEVVNEVWLKLTSDKGDEGWVLFKDEDKQYFKSASEGDSEEESKEHSDSSRSSLDSADQNESHEADQTSETVQSEQTQSADSSEIATGMYLAHYNMKVRQDPDLSAEQIGTVSEGETVSISKTQMSNGILWGYIDGQGWTCLKDSNGSYYTLAQ